MFFNVSIYYVAAARCYLVYKQSYQEVNKEFEVLICILKV